jgi:hypothetical protein
MASVTGKRRPILKIVARKETTVLIVMGQSGLGLLSYFIRSMIMPAMEMKAMTQLDNSQHQILIISLKLYERVCDTMIDLRSGA